MVHPRVTSSNRNEVTPKTERNPPQNELLQSNKKEPQQNIPPQSSRSEQKSKNPYRPKKRVAIKNTWELQTPKRYKQVKPLKLFKKIQDKCLSYKERNRKHKIN